MATIDTTNADETVFIDADQVTIQTILTSDPGLFSFTAFDGTTIVRINGNFTYDANGIPVSGSITSIGFDLSGDVNVDVLINSFSSPPDIGTLITGFTATGYPSAGDRQNAAETFFQTALGEADTFSINGSSGSFNQTLYGDFTTFNSGTLVAAGDTFNFSSPTAFLAVFGDGNNISGSSTVTGGNDQFVLANGIQYTGAIYMDISSLTNGSTLNGGNDTLTGSVGSTVNQFSSNTVYGDAIDVNSASTVNGGDDTVNNTTGSSITFYGDANSLDGGSTLVGGNDNFTSYQSPATLAGGFVDTVYGDVAAIDGGSFFTGGHDTINTGGGDDIIYGDYMSLVSGTIISGGNDTINAGSGDDTVFGNEGNDTISGGDGIDELHGEAGEDIIDGGAGSDQLFGGDDNDILNGGLGVDTVDGGDGIDTLDLSGATNTQKVNLVTNVNIGGFANNDTFLNIENVIGSATRGDDITGTAGSNTLQGLGADDILRGFNGDDILEGGENNDYLYGGRGADVLDGGNGNDWAMYNDSSHGVIVDLGGVGSGGIYSDGDTYISIERVRGSNFDDTITMDGASNKVLAGDGDDTIFGMGGKDSLRGGNDNDRINGGTGNDTMFGDAGSDIFEFDLGSGADWVADFENDIDNIELDGNLAGGAIAGMTIADIVTTYGNQINANRIDLNFGNGDVLKILATGITEADLYDDITVV